jgi:hypothetical protein
MLSGATGRQGVRQVCQYQSQLDAWNQRRCRKADDGVFNTWPNMYKVKAGGNEGYELNKDYDKSVQDLKDYFNEGLQVVAYSMTRRDPAFNLCASLYRQA